MSDFTDGHLHSERHRFNPVEWLQRTCGHDTSNLTYDPTVQPEFRRRQQHACDGTLLLTYMLIEDALLPLLNREVFANKRPPDWERVRDIRYVVGDARIVSVSGIVNLKAGRYPGQRERITIPVRCEYVYVYADEEVAA